YTDRHSFPTRRSSDLRCLQSADEEFRLNRRDECSGGEQYAGLWGGQRGLRALSWLVRGPEQIAMRSEGVDQTSDVRTDQHAGARSEEHTSELQSLAYL